MLRRLYLLILLLGTTHLLSGQTLPVGTTALEDYYRRLQLLGRVDSTLSFAIRPLHQIGNINFSSLVYPDSMNKGSDLLDVGESEWKSEDGKGGVSLLPFSFNLQLNTHHPTGWNDAAMIPSKGLQTLISGGVYARKGPLSIQLKPEIAHQQRVPAARAPPQIFG